MTAETREEWRICGQARGPFPMSFASWWQETPPRSIAPWPHIWLERRTVTTTISPTERLVVALDSDGEAVPQKEQAA